MLGFDRILQVLPLFVAHLGLGTIAGASAAVLAYL